MIEISKGRLSVNRMCGLDGKFRAMSHAMSYIEGNMSPNEYAEFYADASDEMKAVMDGLVLDFLESVKVGAR